MYTTLALILIGIAGGGQRDTTGDPTQRDLQVLAIIGPSGVGLDNPYDNDAAPGHVEQELDQELYDDDHVAPVNSVSAVLFVLSIIFALLPANINFLNFSCRT